MDDKARLWGGVFSESPDALAWRFGRSIDDDRNLWREEIEVSLAHVEMLGKTGIVSQNDAASLLAALSDLSKSPDWLQSHEDAEDIHAAVEAELFKRIGETALRLTAARSRNDQIATVSRLWLFRRISEIKISISEMQSLILDLGKRHSNDPLLGTTHMQGAQPITLGYHLMAYFWMLNRDKKRLANVDPLAECPLGSCALAGTSLAIDRHFVAEKLGFKAPSKSGLDAVSDRDFVGDALHACAQVMLHLSRLCQELILWSTPQFGYVRISDAYSTGSSLMPQKRNPDMAELIRGRAAQAVGGCTAFMTMMHAQPLAYNRDMQDDKPGLYRVAALTQESLVLAAGMLETAVFDTQRMRANCGLSGSTSTGLAEHLVVQGMPFRQAHETVGKLVREAEARGWNLSQVNLGQLRQLLPSADEGALKALGVAGSIASKTSYGGPAPEAFARQLAEAEKEI